MMLWIWLGVIIVTAIIELVTIDLVSIWFTLGGIGAWGSDFCPRLPPVCTAG